jgi:hypothetical protein
VKRPDVPPAARVAARAFAYTSQAEEHPPRSAAMSGRLLLPSGTPPRAGHSSPPPASSPPPQASPRPGAPRRPHKLQPRPLQRSLISERYSGEPRPVFPPPRAASDRNRSEPPPPRTMAAPPLLRQWAASPWRSPAHQDELGRAIGQKQPKCTVDFHNF